MFCEDIIEKKTLELLEEYNQPEAGDEMLVLGKATEKITAGYLQSHVY